ncbi:MAG: hypothetical protein VKL59_09865 [Nostocaceae cyanobacterium]|nr:hypothetical protein [Nostocaceae cyanobacterium]
MTSQGVQIELLIADIDRLLAKKGNRLSRVLSHQTQEQRQVLQSVRSFLVSLQSDQANLSQASKTSGWGASSSPSSGSSPLELLEQQLGIQLQPLVQAVQADVESLQKQREALIQEIRQLEQRRLHDYSLVQQQAQQQQLIGEFLQVLKSRLSEAIPQEWENNWVESRQTPAPETAKQEPSKGQFPQTQPTTPPSLIVGNTGEPSTTKSPNPEPVSSSNSWQTPEQLEGMRRLTMELDQRLLALDTTVNVVFDALQRNIQGYHDSLNHALEKMHSKGVESEHLFNSIVNNMVQQVRQPTDIVNPPSYALLESQLEQKPPTSPVAPSATPLGSHNTIINPIQLPYAGVELPVKNQPLIGVPETEAAFIPSASLNYPPRSQSDDEEVVNTVIQPTESQHLTPISATPTPEYESLDQMPTTPDLVVTSAKGDRNTTPGSQKVTIDPVDELYATLFSSESWAVSAPASSPEPEKPAAAPVTILADTSSVVIAQAVTPNAGNIAPTAPIPQAIGSENITNTTNITSGKTPEIATGKQPPATDTIKSLTDLLVELGGRSSPSLTPAVAFTETFNPPLPDGNTGDALQLPTTTPEDLGKPPTDITDHSGQVRETPSAPPSTDDSLTIENFPTDQGQQPQPITEVTKAVVTSPTLGERLTTLFQNAKTKQQTSKTVPESPPLTDSSVVDIPHLSSLWDNPAPVPLSSQPPQPATSPEVSDEPEMAEDVPEDSLSPWQVSNYTAASKDENLLVTESQKASAMPEISLDEDMWQQLQEDLANLESPGNTEFSPAFREVDIPEAFTNSPGESPTVLWESPEDQEQKKKSEEDNQQVKPQQDDDIPAAVSGQFLPPPNSVWYLGIDLGSTGISAALLNTQRCEVYPLYWSGEDKQDTTSLKRYFRLPAVAELPAVGVPHEETSNQDSTIRVTPVLDDQQGGSLATISAPPIVATVAKYDVFAAHLKPHLQVGIPYISPTTKTWQPMLQFSKFSNVPLIWVRRTLSRLLSTINPHGNLHDSQLKARVSGLGSADLASILNHLEGVIFSCPSAWSEQYRFNVREAVLESNLVTSPEQIFFVEEAIATLLSELPQPDGTRIKLPTPDNYVREPRHWVVGDTLIINAGAVSTELALVNLPVKIENLTHSDFLLHSFAYAGDAIDQDIICQLLCNPRWRRSRFDEYDEESREASHWQPNIPGLDDMYWDSLQLEKLDLPRAGETDLMARIRLQQVLCSSLLGRAVMDAAIAVKLILQTQDACNLELADKRWLLRRQDLEAMVLVPYVQRLNRELNRLLVNRGVVTEAIHQVICTGGTAALGAITRWLRQKLPNATITQDLYSGESGSPACSRVAYGLAMLPLHPHVLEVARQQYSDYFLFAELLRVTPNRPITFGEIIRLLEERGINTYVCQQRLLSFLENQLPPGLVPNDVDSCWLTEHSRNNADYKALTAAPLFEKQGTLTFVPNTQQLLRLRRYLNWVIAGTHQSFDEPYTVNLETVVGNG